MANKDPNFFTRIQLKYDTYENWKTINPTLLKGEVAIVNLTSEVEQSEVNNKGKVDGGEVESAILIKVGDDETPFNNLPWLSAKAADVYNWAKQDEEHFLDWLAGNNKEYTDNAKITFATDAELDTKLTALKNTVYTTASASGKILTLTKGDGKQENFDFSQPSAGKNLGLVKSGGNVTISDGIITVKDDSHTHDGRYYTGGEVDEIVNGINNKFTTLSGDYDDEGSIKKIATEAIAHALADADEDFDTLIEMSDWIAGHPNDVATMNSNISALVTALGDDYVKFSEDGTSITAGKSSVTNKVTALETRVDKLRIDQIKNCETAEDPSQQTYVIFNCGTASFLI